jgi:hypothetical protein
MYVYASSISHIAQVYGCMNVPIRIVDEHSHYGDKSLSLRKGDEKRRGARAPRMIALAEEKGKAPIRPDSAHSLIPPSTYIHTYHTSSFLLTLPTTPTPPPPPPYIRHHHHNSTTTTTTDTPLPPYFPPPSLSSPYYVITPAPSTKKCPCICEGPPPRLRHSLLLPTIHSMSTI